jgi:hypothetical protein
MSLEQELGLPSLEEAIAAATKMKEQASEFNKEATTEIVVGANVESISSLVSADELQKLDKEFDEIAEDALEQFDTLIDHAFNSAPSHQGKLFEVAASMMTTALNARTAKVDKKLKLMKMQLEQAKFERMLAKEQQNPVQGTIESETVVKDSRNRIMEEIYKMMDKEKNEK